MVVGAFPVAKLGALLVKQISKPIANAIKEKAKTSPLFRKYVCLPPAQFYNWCELKAKMWVLNLGKPVSLPVYNEEMAIELGANLLGEGIIFLIAAGLLVAEYNRSARKEAAKEAAKKKEIEELQLSLKELFIQTEQQAAHIRELRRKLGELDTKIGDKQPSRHTTDASTPPSKPPPTNETHMIKPQTFPIISEVENSDINLNLSVESKLPEKTNAGSSFLLNIVNDVENEFWRYPPSEYQPGILTWSLNHLYQNVYGVKINPCI
ncbi:putative OPA3-like protein CG13603 [Coccinella septempunctata]|uniref:putative OPA3-like protein CG13603 n=1 Tax=Coccinella septempunctata TaxID=41139 RepID=UPI001D06DBF9|nr:putative OPA3-like protein CG13603 [Coccinella septempunctata]